MSVPVLGQPLHIRERGLIEGDQIGGSAVRRSGFLSSNKLSDQQQMPFINRMAHVLTHQSKLVALHSNRVMVTSIANAITWQHLPIHSCRAGHLASSAAPSNLRPLFYLASPDLPSNFNLVRRLLLQTWPFCAMQKLSLDKVIYYAHPLPLSYGSEFCLAVDLEPIF